MKITIAVMAAALSIATIATTVAWAYPTTAERTADIGKSRLSVEAPPSQTAMQIRVILPAPWKSNAPAKR